MADNYKPDLWSGWSGPTAEEIKNNIKNYKPPTQILDSTGTWQNFEPPPPITTNQPYGSQTTNIQTTTQNDPSNFLGNLLTKASTLAKATSKIKLNTKPPELRTNLVPVSKGVLETNNAFRPTKEATVRHGVQEILKQAQNYDPFAVVNKTPEQMKDPFLYLQKELDEINKPTMRYIKYSFLGGRIKGEGWKEITDAGKTYSKELITNLIQQQKDLFGSDLSKLDNKYLSSIDWKGFYEMTAKMKEYQSLRNSYIDKRINNKNPNDTSAQDWMNTYDKLMNSQYKAIGEDMLKAVQAGRTSYDTILQTKNTTIDAIKEFLPDNKTQTRKVLDVGNQNQRDMIAGRVKKIKKLTETNYKPTPVFENRPS